MQLYATELMGAETYDDQGNFVGRVREFFIEPADQPNRVARLLLSRGRFQPLVARYDQVATVAPGTIRLNCNERALELYQPNEGWLAVRKDLLDQQIIDTQGRKVVRVNDVDLAEFRTNGTVELRLTQVDVGLPGAVRRLLQGVVSPSVVRKLQAELPQRTIRWEFVNLIEPDPLRRVKLRITHEKLEDLHPADLAEIMESLSAAERQGIIASLDEEMAGKVLAELDERLTRQIVEKLDPEKAADILEEMAPDAAAELLAELPKETSEELLDEMPGQEARGRARIAVVRSLDSGRHDEYGVCVFGRDRDARRSVGLDADTGFESRSARFGGAAGQRGAIFGNRDVARLLMAVPEDSMSELKLEPLLSVPAECGRVGSV